MKYAPVTWLQCIIAICKSCKGVPLKEVALYVCTQSPSISQAFNLFVDLLPCLSISIFVTNMLGSPFLPTCYGKYSHVKASSLASGASSPKFTWLNRRPIGILNLNIQSFVFKAECSASVPLYFILLHYLLLKERFLFNSLFLWIALSNR